VIGPAEARPQPRHAALQIAVAAAVVLALGLAVQGSLGASWSTSLRGPLAFGEALLYSSLVFGSWVPFALAVAARARPLPAGRRARRRAVALWMAGSLVIAALHVVVAEGLVVAASAARALPVGGLHRSLPAAFRLHFHESLFLAVATVACALAVREYGVARENEVRLTRAREELSRAKLQMLRYQLQPHFLFNALNSISAEVYEDAGRADRMICSLSEFLRRSLDPEDASEIELERELELVRGYLDVERFRFGSRLALELRVEPALARALVPPLLLQPLVENAVRHGVARSLEPVRIAVAAERAGGELVLRVADDARPVEASARRVGGGLGIANSRRRLHQLYGAAASLAARPLDGRGFEVVVRLPYRMGGKSGTGGQGGAVAARQRDETGGE
jgi:hypothetical protein